MCFLKGTNASHKLARAQPLFVFFSISGQIPNCPSVDLIIIKNHCEKYKKKTLEANFKFLDPKRILVILLCVLFFFI
jgi:hypothetical protein